MEVGPRSINAAASPAIARMSPPPAPSPSTVAVRSIPSDPTHHRSSPLATQAQRSGGPGCCTTSSLGSASVGSDVHEPSRPTTTRRSSRSSSTGRLPSNESSAPSTAAPRSMRSTVVDVVRRSAPSTIDHTPPSGAINVTTPVSMSNPTGSPAGGTTSARSPRWSTTTSPSCPTADVDAPVPSVDRFSGEPSRNSTGSI